MGKTILCGLSNDHFWKITKSFPVLPLKLQEYSWEQDILDQKFVKLPKKGLVFSCPSILFPIFLKEKSEKIQKGLLECWNLII